MKRRYIFVLAILVGVLIAQASTHAQTRRKAIKAKPSLSLDQQAEQQAQSFWRARIIKCGPDSYTKDRSYIHQFKNPRIEVKAFSVSTADKLNGIEYIGSTSYKVELSRSFSPKPTLYQDAGWSKWTNDFTMSMGGIGLESSIRKERGHWNVTPMSISQSGVIQLIGCHDAYDPEAYFRRIYEASYSAEVRKIIEDCPTWGIYMSESPRIPSEMIRFLYEYRQRNELNKQNAAAFSPDSGWIVNRNGSLIYTKKGLADDLVTNIKNITYGISTVAFNPPGGWIIIYERDGGGRQFWSYSNLYPQIGEQLEALKNLSYDKKSISVTENGVRSISFDGKGGWIMVWGKNGYLASNVSREIEATLAGLTGGTKSYIRSRLQIRVDI